MPHRCRFHDHEERGRPDFWKIERSRLEFHSTIAQDNNVSEVWKASLYDPATERMHDVAVKFFPLDSCGAACGKIWNEINLLLLAASRCEHVCKAYGWSSDEKGVYIVMKRYEASVHSRMREHEHGRLPLGIVKRYATQLCSALIGLHEQGIVVADLKPANFLLDEFDNLVVSDFGISTIHDTALERCDDGVYGTFNYMSPEAFDAEAFGKVSPKSDAWALACCVIEMVSGITPWLGKAMSAICYKVTQTSERPVVPDELPPAVREALQQCFSTDPVHRPSIRQLLEVLVAWDTARQAGGEHADASESLFSFASSSRRSVLEDGAAGWREEREQLRASVKNLREKLMSSQEVSRILREQLYVVVGTLKEQQEQSKPRACSACTEHQLAKVELSNQLRQCRKQKEVAKKMLVQENERSKRLTAELDALSASRRLSSRPPLLLASELAHSSSSAFASLAPETLLSADDLRTSDLDSQASTPALGSARSVESVDWATSSASSVPLAVPV